jgi:hypothetical protein
MKIVEVYKNNKAIIFSFVALLLVIVLSTVAVLIVNNQKPNSDIKSDNDSIGVTITPTTDNIFITPSVTQVTYSATVSPTAKHSRTLIELPAIKPNQTSLVVGLVQNDYCKGLEIRAEIPSDSSIISKRTTTVNTCLEVELKNKDYQMFYSVSNNMYIGERNISNVVGIGTTQESPEVYRFTQSVDHLGKTVINPIYTYHTFYIPEWDIEDNPSDLFPLVDFYPLYIECQGKVDICDSIVRSIQTNTLHTD